MARRKRTAKNSDGSQNPRTRFSTGGETGLTQNTKKKRKCADGKVNETVSVKVNKIDKSQKQSSGSADNVDWQLGKSVTESISAAQSSEKWSDISFRCHDQDENNEAIQAHKFILASRSPVFEAMFFGPMKETKDEIYLEDVTAETFKLFLRYLYTDDVDLNYTTAEELVLVAHKYRVSKCVDFCSNFLTENIEYSRACGILQIALFLNLTKLETAVMKYIQERAVLVFQSEDFLIANVPTLVRIIKDSNLNITETVVFKYMDKWAAKQCKEENKKATGPNKRAAMQDVFHLIRFRSMEVKDFISIMLKKEYFSLVEYEEILADITGVKSMRASAYGGRKRSKFYLPKTGNTLKHWEKDMETLLASL